MAIVFARSAPACHRAVLHLREGAPDVPVWVFSTAPPLPETAALCERVAVRPSATALLLAAERQAWPRWVALSVAPWTGDHGGWPLKLAPFLIPPGRALLLNENGDFFAGSPAAVARHLGRRFHDAAGSLWNGARDLAHRTRDGLRDAGRVVKLGGLMAASIPIAWFARHWFARLHGVEALPIGVGPAEADAPDVATVPHRAVEWDRAALSTAVNESGARLILWGTGAATAEMLALFDDPRTFAVSRQLHVRGWKPSVVPAAPFRQLQPGEFSQVTAPLSDTILVDREKLLALGIPGARLAGTAWLLLFWQAAAAGWRSYSAGGDAPLAEQPDSPMQEAAFFVRALRDRSLLRLGPREPELGRGAAAFRRLETPPARRTKPRVLVVSPFLPYPLSHGGAVRIWNLCRTLAPRVDFLLTAVREKDERVEYAKLAEVFREIRVVDIDQRASKDASLPGQVRHHRSAVLRAAVADLARQWQPDLLQVEYTHMAHFRDAAPHVPAILVEHDLTFSLYRQLAESRGAAGADAEYRRWLAFERRWLKAYDGVWTVSEEDRDAAVRESGRRAERTFNVPNGVDVERYRPEPPAGAPEILYVGSFRHLPNTIGFEKLEREVMPRVWQRFPDARLTVVAGPRYEEFWQKRPLDGRIEMRGFVEDLRPLYARAAAVAVPLEVSAGTNIKVLEAMACGRAVVSTPVGCAGLGLEDGADALIRADWEGFAGAVCALLGDRSLRDRIADRARAVAEARFSWSAIADRAWESYCAVNVAVETLSGSL